ncbi:MAG: hypothetical protein AB7F19_07230 [Candidatus Babeliales bacterium]
MKQIVYLAAFVTFILGSVTQTAPILTTPEKNIIISWCNDEYSYAPDDVKFLLKALYEFVDESFVLMERAVDSMVVNPNLIYQYNLECNMQIQELANSIHARVGHLVGKKEIYRFLNNNTQKLMSVPLVEKMYELAGQMTACAISQDVNQLNVIRNDIRQLHQDLQEIGALL